MATTETLAPAARLAAEIEKDEQAASTPAEPAGTPPAPEPSEANEDAPGDESAEAAKSEAPESSYKPFTLPEGMAVNKDLLEKATPVFEQMKLNQEQAQQLIDLYVESVAGQASALQEQQAAQVKAWINAVQKDKELSDPFAMAGALKLVKEYGDKDFMSLLDSTGIGNHPAVVRFMQKVAAQFAEDRVVHGRITAPPKDRNPLAVLTDYIASAETPKAPE